MIDLYKPFNLIAAYEEADKDGVWLRDTFFPCNPSTDMFTTDEVFVEIKDAGDALTAPFVVPEVRGRYIERKGYRTSRLAPAFMGIKTKLTFDDLKKKGFGEQYFQEVDPETRARKLLMRDMRDMERRLSRSEEMICAKLLTGNGYELKHYGEEYSDPELYKNVKVQFHDGDDPTLFTPAKAWDLSSTTIIDDLHAMVKKLEDNHQPASHLIVSWDVAEVIYKNTQIREDIKTFSNINLMQGQLSPEKLPNNVTRICTLNVYGTPITVYAYTGKYVDPETKKDALYIPEKTAILTAPNCGKMLYGGIEQMTDSGEFDIIAAKRVPYIDIDKKRQTRELCICSRPLAVPAAMNPWVHATVL